MSSSFCNCSTSSYISYSFNGKIKSTSRVSATQICSASCATKHGGHPACLGGVYHHGHLSKTSFCSHPSGDNTLALGSVLGPVVGYPHKKHTKNNDKDTNTQQEQQGIQCRFEWFPLVTSKYYRINVKQNKKSTKYTIESSSECKQFVDINVLPVLPANILVVGYDVDPNITPKHKPIDKYATMFTITSSDPYTYVYENKSTTRRKDKEINGSVVFEASVIEGVCSHT